MFHFHRSLPAAQFRPGRLTAPCFVLLAFMILAFSAIPTAAPAESGKVLATVNGTAITEAELDAAADAFADSFAQFPEEQRRAIILSTLVDSQLSANAAADTGYRNSAAYKNLMRIYEMRILQDFFIKQIVGGSITDNDIQAAYDEQVADFPVQDEVRARHILVDDEAVAIELVAALDAGGDFVELAREKSIGPSAPDGGDLGYFTRERMVPAFAAAAFDLAPGSYTKTPVQTQFGWHVILVEDRRKTAPPPLDAVREQVHDGLMVSRLQAQLKTLKETAKIEILDEELASSPIFTRR